MKREYSVDGGCYHYPTSERQMDCPVCGFQIGLAKKWHNIVTCPGCGEYITIERWKKNIYETKW